MKKKVGVAEEEVEKLARAVEENGERLAELAVKLQSLGERVYTLEELEFGRKA